MNATTSQQSQPKPGFRKIMTWNPKRSSKKLHLSYENTPGMFIMNFCEGTLLFSFSWL